MELWISNGLAAVRVSSYKNGLYDWSPQQVIRLRNYISLTNNMRIIFKVNNSNDRNYQEAALDKIQVNELNIVTNTEKAEILDNNSVTLQAFPIPFGEVVTVAYEIPNFQNKENQYLTLFNLLGQPLETIRLTSNSGKIQVGRQLAAGVYFLQIGKTLKKVIKQ